MMKKELIDYYQKELHYLERVGQAFSQKYPKISHRLQMTDQGGRDPHVERLIQATALLNARIRAKLEDDYPELTQSVFDLIYPHYLKPIPSHSVICFESESDMSAPVNIPRGSALDGRVSETKTCRFTTLYDVDVLPLRLCQASLQSAPFAAPQIAQLQQISGLLHLEFDIAGLDAQSIDSMPLERVRIYLNAPKHIAYPLYELLFNQVHSWVMAESEVDVHPMTLDLSGIQAVGFKDEEAAWAYSEQSSPGYRLLSEFFVFPEKFLFFELDLSALRRMQLKTTRFSLFFYLKNAYDEIAPHVKASHFQLYATPIINLYSQLAESVRLTHTRTSYPVVADSRDPEATQVYTVKTVTLSNKQNLPLKLKRFFDFDGSADVDDLSRPFWHLHQETSTSELQGGELSISLHNLPLDILSDDTALLFLDCLVTNGNCPHQLWKSGKLKSLTLAETKPGIEKARTLLAFKPASFDHQKGQHWKLISHLNLNYLSLGKEGTAGRVLKEILSLYDFKNSPETRKMIDSLSVASVDMEMKRVVSASGVFFFSRGHRFHIKLNAHDFPGASAFLFCSVLERFLALYTQINSFTQLDVSFNQHEECVYSWPPRTGDQCLI